MKNWIAYFDNETKKLQEIIETPTTRLHRVIKNTNCHFCGAPEQKSKYCSYQCASFAEQEFINQIYMNETPKEKRERYGWTEFGNLTYRPISPRFKSKIKSLEEAKKYIESFFNPK